MAENLMGKNTRHYMLINPDLYTDLTTRLKYATLPTVRNLVVTDQEIDTILRDANLPLREKRCILSDALYRLQLYKSFPPNLFTDASTSTTRSRQQQMSPSLLSASAYQWQLTEGDQFSTPTFPPMPSASASASVSTSANRNRPISNMDAKF